MRYDNTVFTLIDKTCPDPWLTKWNDKYFLTFTVGHCVDVISSPSLVGFEHNASRHTIWTPPTGTEYSSALWAPELHALAGRWYVYVAAAHPAVGNASHRMYVLGGPPSSQNPTQGGWEFLGPIRNMQDHWAIDGTVITLRNEHYFVYSGWPLNNPGLSDLVQELYIVRLADPITAGSQNVLISTPEYPWEFSHDGNGAHGINEGPQLLTSPDGTWIGIGYSCAGSWTNEYKTAYLQWDGGDPLSKFSWSKCQRPLIQSDRKRGPWGPGHGCFLNIGLETLYIYHATDAPGDGWNNRKPRVQRVAWRPDGPFMGETVGLITTDRDLFSKFVSAETQSPNAPTTSGEVGVNSQASTHDSLTPAGQLKTRMKRLARRFWHQ